MSSILCNTCKHSPVLYICSGCYQNRYCSYQCQTEDWLKNKHHETCNVFITGFTVPRSRTDFMRRGNMIVVALQVEAITLKTEKPPSTIELKDKTLQIEWRKTELPATVDDVAGTWITESFKKMKQGYSGKTVANDEGDQFRRLIQPEDPLQNVGKIPPPEQGVYRVYMIREIVMTYSNELPAKVVADRDGTRRRVPDTRFVSYDEQPAPNIKFRLWRNVMPLLRAKVGRQYFTVRSTSQDLDRDQASGGGQPPVNLPGESDIASLFAEECFQPPDFFN